MAEKAKAIDTSMLTYKARSDASLPMSAHPKLRVALCASSVDSHPQGGSGKLVNGHSIDTVAIVNGLISGGIAGASSFTM